MRLMKYPGGKAGMLRELLPLIPYDHAYVEVFGGAGSILLNRTPSPIDVYNDLDGALANLFRVLRDPDLYAEFARRVDLTLYGAPSQNEAVDILASFRSGTEPVDPVQLAWALYTQMNMSVVGSVRRTKGQWSRTMAASGGMAATVAAWHSLVGNLPIIHERLRTVTVDSRPAVEIVEYWDSEQTVFYLDPPYVLETRLDNIYAVELPDEGHVELVEKLKSIKGYAVVSGYDHPLYLPLTDECGWRKVDYEMLTPMTASHRSKDEGWDREAKPRGERTETVWLNPRAAEWSDSAGGRLFAID